MHPTLRVCAGAARVHKPLIHFIGKRTWPSKPEPPHAHPAGPAEYKKAFSDFVKKFQSSASGSTSSSSGGKEAKPGVFTEFWQAPSRIWNPRVRSLSEDEIEAVATGGASTR
ncbi:hypothetical protein SCHPADRAFT_846434, partial [Schizopora paradoxa]